jgi:hypothetical protein
MTPVGALSYHLKELGVMVRLTADARNLELDAPEGVLTPELVGFVRDHKSDLVESVYLMDEAEAIAWEGCQFSEGVAIRAAEALGIEFDDEGEISRIPASIDDETYCKTWRALYPNRSEAVQ